MASLYKKPVLVRDQKTGQKVKTKSRKWWGRFRDEHGQEKRVPLATDKTAAQAMLSELVKKVERRVIGIEDPFDQYRSWSLADHLNDFTVHLQTKGSTADYVDTTTQRVRAILEGCRFERLDHISASS